MNRLNRWCEQTTGMPLWWVLAAWGVLCFWLWMLT